MHNCSFAITRAAAGVCGVIWHQMSGRSHVKNGVQKSWTINSLKAHKLKMIQGFIKLSESREAHGVVEYPIWDFIGNDLDVILTVFNCWQFKKGSKEILC
jgi:hypothetical protein